MRQNEHSKTVFIFGAGASVSCNAPLMKDFLDRAEELYLGDLVDPGRKEDFKLVFEALYSMQGLHSKSNINLDNIEDVFGAFEIGKIIKKVGKFKKSKINKLPDSTKILITYTLESVCEFRQQNRTVGSNDLSDYQTLIIKMRDKPAPINFQDTVFISFNYDVCLDLALYNAIKERESDIDYGLQNSVNQSHSQVLKLHGSINWGICPKCKKVFSVNWQEYLKYLRARLDNQPGEAKLSFISLYHKFKKCQCNAPVNAFTPAIVPPTWNKTANNTDFNNKISNVWKHAAQAMAEAEDFYIIGYSLPETDVFFRLLFALGSESSTRLKRFWIFNPDTSAKPRFDRIIGQSRIHRYEFIAVDFNEAIKLIFHPKQIQNLPKDENGARIIPKRK